jgi:lantibiotic modifying enzyme
MGLGMDGAGGYLRGLDVLAAGGHLSPEARGRAVDEILDSITVEHVDRARAVDHMAGPTGLVGPLCRIVAETGDDRALLLIRAAADAIVDRQDPESGGWLGHVAPTPLTGMAHGASGMALALAEASVALDSPSHLAAMRRGLAYEAAVFDPRARNWPDLRPSVRTTGSAFMQGWCAGAPGIGLTRLRLLELLPGDPDAAQWREELDRAARTTADGPLLMGDHVCCGNLGRVVILRRMAVVTGDQEWAAAAATITDAVVARAGGGLPYSALGATPEAMAMPGLMMGLTGIALALADDGPGDWVPLVLL